MTPGAQEGGVAVALRPVQPADAPLLLAWRGEESVRRHQPLRDLTLAELRAELAALCPSELWRGQGDRFIWLVLAERRPVGWITLLVVSWEHGLAEVGYALGTEHQGKGWMRPALELLLRDLFALTPLFRIEARCAVGNVASQRLLAGLGFREEGVLRSYFRLRGERVDNRLFALLRTDWARRAMEEGTARRA
ncbi:MAG: GNAT family N-acetyltransferase [Thermoanaerobaculia bacterium]|nr:GNAT family N-acetyltransferase [Thermoanaerobaculia bacterium]